MAAHEVPATAETIAIGEQRSMRRMVWRQFRRHPAALFSITVLGIVIAASVLAPVIAPYDPYEFHPTDRFAPPSPEHWFGTDNHGRDVFSRILYGGRITLLIGVLAMAVSMLLGLLVGVLAGASRGWLDGILMRTTDFFLIYPQIFVLLFLSYLLRQADIEFFAGGFGNIVLVIAITSWMVVARLVRATFLKLREEDYVSAARAYGAGYRRLVIDHILPGAYGVILVAATRGVADAILVESGLSFLGYGIQSPAISWGNMLQEAYRTIGVYPWLTFYPGFMIFITVLALFYLGDALRDALDPYKIVGAVRQ